MCRWLLWLLGYREFSGRVVRIHLGRQRFVDFGSLCGWRARCAAAVVESVSLRPSLVQRRSGHCVCSTVEPATIFVPFRAPCFVALFKRAFPPSVFPAPVPTIFRFVYYGPLVCRGMSGCEDPKGVELDGAG